jgi:hypothetical protein
MRRFVVQARFTTIAVLSLLATACDGGPTIPAEEEVVVREIILAGDDGDFVFSHHDHWHGAPFVHAGANASYSLRFVNVRAPADDHDPAPVEQWFTLAAHPDHEVRVVIEDTTVARWSGDRVRGTLHGLREGASRMTFVVRRGTTTIYEGPPLNFRVQP